MCNFFTFSVYSVCFSVVLVSLLYLVDASQMAIFVETELIILLFMCCNILHVVLCCT